MNERTIRRLAVVHPQNPFDPHTWSGTTRNLIEALQEKAVDVIPVQTGPTTFPGKFSYRCAQKLRGSDLTFSPVFRRRARSLLTREMARESLSTALHLGSTSAVPMSEASYANYLYCDSSWHRLTTNTVGLRIRKSIDLQVTSLESAALRRFRHIFTVSEVLRRDLLEEYGVEPDRVTTVGTGRGNIAPNFEPKDFSAGRILFAAKVDFEQKGGQLLLDAFRIAVREEPRLSLTIVGLDELRGVPNVTVTGFIPWDELQQHFHSASLFAMPALFEPWGLVYLEALASRTPILGLRRNALPEITGGGRYGFLIDEATPEALARGLLEAVSDPERLAHMAAEGQRYCLERYSWQRVADTIISEIDQSSAN
jgi:glycosyltransferase involved in cell wall biosynthesis